MEKLPWTYWFSIDFSTDKDGRIVGNSENILEDAGHRPPELSFGPPVDGQSLSDSVR